MSTNAPKQPPKQQINEGAFGINIRGGVSSPTEGTSRPSPPPPPPPPPKKQ